MGIKELNEGFDFHGDNQLRLGLPERLHAKTFIFRLLFGGSAFAYASDPVFTGISTKADFWQDKIDVFYDKYKGVAAWHSKLMNDVQSTGIITLPTGRSWKFAPILKRGELTFPRTQILNYPVQGLGADLMTLVRVSLFRRMKAAGLESLLISTIHDSVMIDAIAKEVDILIEMLYNVWSDLPKNFEKQFGVPFNLITRCEIQTGHNWKDMIDAN